MHSEKIINRVFDWCVWFLYWLAGHLGMTYKAINVWIFCVLWPIFTMVLVVVVVLQRRKIRALGRG